MNRGIAGVLLFFVVLGFGNGSPLFGEESAKQAEFYLGPGDVLEVSVWKDEALSRQVVVRPDGNISFPLIGDVQAQGRTVGELRKAVEDKIKGFVPDAPVNVMVMEVGSPKVYVVGKVGKPGVYIMGEPLRVMQVLAMAGGMTTFAQADDIIIIRNENEGQEVFEFNYSRVAVGKDLEQNIRLRSGDTVVVP
jgi:polysaccharide export outer membrane protein